MKIFRKIIAVLLCTLLAVTGGAGMLAGCNASNGSADDSTVSSQNEQTQPAPGETENTEDVIGHEDTYWTAFEWHSEDDDGTENSGALPTELWSLDLIIRVDGTARFRDIHEGICLMDDSYLNLVWERTPQGQLQFYSALSPEPILRGGCKNGVLTLEYWGTTLSMKQEPMPQTVGQMHSPAELAGTWLMVSGETEGWQWEAMPGRLESLVIQVIPDNETLVLSADMEERDYYGELMYSGYGQRIEVLYEPLYEGADNGDWCVRIGEESPLDANGFPEETELYATLLNYNTLVLQRYYTMDGYPAVSHQTYTRLTDLVSWMNHEAMNLKYSNWVCTGYQDVAGESLPLPTELEGFSVVLSPDQSCTVCYGSGDTQQGTWILGNGGVLLMRGEEEAEDPFWLGGAISGYWVDTPERPIETYQMALYYKGGILKLSMDSYG